MSSHNNAAVTAVGKVNMQIRDVETKAVLDKFTVKNNVLNVGRTALLKSLANSASHADSFFYRCVVSNGGAEQSGSTFIEKKVLKDRTGLFNSPGLDAISVVTTVTTGSNGDPYAICSSVLGAQSEANGYYINEVGLQLKSQVSQNECYALVTWPGTYKTSSIEIVLDWLVYFL